MLKAPPQELYSPRDPLPAWNYIPGFKSQAYNG